MKEFAPAKRDSNVIQFPLPPTLERNSDGLDDDDAQSGLGGGTRPYREPEVLQVYRNLSFFDIYEQTPENAWQVEVRRAYDLSLDGTLRPDHVGLLTKKDAETLAIAVHDLYTTLNHRAPLLLLEGNYENPTFEKYQLQSQEQANQYAGVLFALRDGLDEQPVVQQLLALQREQHLHKSISSRKRDEARRLRRVVVDENDKVTLEYSGAPAPLRLRSVTQAGL